MDVLTWFANLSSGHDRSLAAATSCDAGDSSDAASSSAFARVFVRASLETEVLPHRKRGGAHPAAPQSAPTARGRGKRNASDAAAGAADGNGDRRDALRYRRCLLRALRGEERRPGHIGDDNYSLAKNIAPRIHDGYMYGSITSTSTSTSTRPQNQNGPRRRQQQHQHQQHQSSHSVDVADELMSRFILLPDVVHCHHRHHPGKTPSTSVALTIDPDFVGEDGHVDALVAMANGLIHSSPAASAPTNTSGHKNAGRGRKRRNNAGGFLSKRGVVATHGDCGAWPSWYVGGLTAHLDDPNDGDVQGLVCEDGDGSISVLFHGEVSAQLLKCELVLFALARMEMTIRGSYRQALRAIAMSRTASSKFSSAPTSASAGAAPSKAGGKNFGTGKGQQEGCARKVGRSVFPPPADGPRRRNDGAARPDEVTDWMSSLLLGDKDSNLKQCGVCIPVEFFTHVLSKKLSTNGYKARTSLGGLDAAVGHLIGQYYDAACRALPPPPPRTPSPRRVPSREDRAKKDKVAKDDKAKKDKQSKDDKAKEDKAKDDPGTPTRTHSRSTDKGASEITIQDSTPAEPAKESPSEATIGATTTTPAAKKKKKRKKKKKKKGGTTDNGAATDQSPPSPSRGGGGPAASPAAAVAAPPKSQSPSPPPRNSSPRRGGGGGGVSPAGSSESASGAVAVAEEQQWEVVAARPKGRNSKASRQPQPQQQNDSRGNKFSPPPSPYVNSHHRRLMHRQSNKIVRDVLSIVLENVWSEVDARHRRRQQQQEQMRLGATSSGTSQPVGGGCPPPPDPSKATEKRPPATALEAVVMGGPTALEAVVMGGPTVSSKPPSNIASAPANDHPRRATVARSRKPASGAHHAAPNRNEHEATSTKKEMDAPGVIIPTSTDESAGEVAAPPVSKRASIEGPINSADLSQEAAAASVPVPRVLGMPEAGLLDDDDRSASSSVSSSLETPSGMHHLSRGRRRGGGTRRRSSTEEGYPLLDMCDRLSSDMSLFMHRRAHALEDRRLERRLLLGALQGTVGGIWTPGCHVEMYGSCATQLDLPSSDLDLVVRGVDAVAVGGGVGGGGKKKRQQQHRQQREIQAGLDAYQHSFGYGNFSPNAARVLRLAMELERQPWAVQVKPIPTAMIPVVKVLADPTRLPGAAKARVGAKAADFVHRGGDVAWAAAAGQRGAAEAMRAQQPGAAAHHIVPSSSSSSSDQAAAAAPPVAQMMIPPPWRGADLLNGLLSVDITFEGAGHGGVGSTAYAARVVQEACDEGGLPPDATPAVRITMVLKELLAQRRLNEPFSGGLSSYSLLLMVCAVIREAKLIRLDRAEQQRHAAAAVDDATKTFRESGAPVSNATEDSSTSAQSTGVSPRDVVDGSSSSLPTGSTWAAVAKSKPTEKKSMQKEERPAAAKNPGVPSYAEKASGKGALKKARNNSSSATAMNRSTTTSPTVAMTLSSEEVGNSNIIDPKPVGTANNLPHWVSNPHGVSNDVLDVLCSGEATAGKLLMHFFLFYGKYFDAQTMAIDMNSPYSPFVSRKSGGQIDPVTGVFSVDPLVVYDPLEGQEGNNVARSCFAWYSIRQVFSQCFATLVQSLESQVLGGENGNDMVPLLALLLSF